MELIARKDLYTNDFGEIEQILTKNKRYEIKETEKYMIIIDDTNEQDMFLKETINNYFYIDEEEYQKEEIINIIEIVRELKKENIGIIKDLKEIIEKKEKELSEV